jgi:hypothetical protein
MCDHGLLRQRQKTLFRFGAVYSQFLDAFLEGGARPIFCYNQEIH